MEFTTSPTHARGSRPSRRIPFAPRVLILAAGFAGAGCASAARDWKELPDSRSGAPRVALWQWRQPSEEAVRVFREARRLAGLGHTADSLRLLRTVASQDPGFLEPRRLTQDLLLVSVADARLRREHRELAEGSPEEADTWYLLGRIEPVPERQAAYFERAIGIDPTHPFARVGRALVRERAGDVEGAMADAVIAAASAPWLALPWLFQGQVALAHGEPAIAERHFNEAANRDDGDPTPWLGVAAAAQQLGRPREASRAALAAMRRAPGDPSVVAICTDVLERAGVPSDLEAAVTICDGALGAVRDPGPVHVLAARCEIALGCPEAALESLQAARDAGVGPEEFAHRERTARVAAGDPAAAVASYLETLPGEVTGGDHLFAPRWNEVAAAAAAYDRADPRTVERLADGMLALGWLSDASQLFAQARALAPQDERLQERAAGEAAFRLFLEDLDRVAREERARSLRGADGTSVEEALARVGALSLDRLGRDVTEGAVVHSYPFVGSFAASVASGGAFQREFTSRGLFLLAGRRGGRPVELVLGRLVLVRSGARETVLGTDLDFDECWIDSEDLPPHVAGLQGGLAGLTLDRLVFVQLDAVRRTPRSLDPGIELELRPAETRADLLALDTPSLVAARIEAGLPQGRATPQDLLDAVRRHELIHVYDARRLLPVHRNPLRGLAFVIENGFSPRAAEAKLEGRAALLSIEESRSPRASLASMLAFLPAIQGRTLQHPAAYARIAQEMVKEIAEHPADFPEIDPGFNILQQMDRLGDERVRELARRTSRRY